MAYDTKELYQKALTAIEENKLFFVEDVAAYLGIVKSTFYDHFKEGSNESNAIKEQLEKNKITVKVSLRSKWYKSDAPALQLALYKIIGTEEEAHRLNGSKQEVQQRTITEPAIDLNKFTDEELRHFEQLMLKASTSGTSEA